MSRGVSTLLRASAVALLLTGLAPLIPANELTSPATSAFAQNRQAQKKTTTVRTGTTVRRAGTSARQSRTTVRRATTVRTQRVAPHRPAQIRPRVATTTRVYHRRPHHWRPRPVTRPVFIYLGGPRIIMRSYGPGWCRGLHRGWHWAPRVGWHSRQHVGLYRCR